MTLRDNSHPAKGLGVRGTMAILAICVITLGTLTATSGQSLAGGRHAALIIDANTGRVLHAQFADEPRYPASLAKMMTLYIVFEQLQQGRLKQSSRIKISENAANTPPSRLDLERRQRDHGGRRGQGADHQIRERHGRGSRRAHFRVDGEICRLDDPKGPRAVGMGSTVFKNPHGLPDADQVTTARDMVTLALRLNDHFPRYYALFATRTFAYNGSLYRNHNTLLGRFEGTDGIKTGYTSASGFNLVSSVRRDGKHVVGAIFGGSTAASRNAHMKTLLTRALHNASDEKTRRPALIAKAPSEERPAPRPVAARRDQAARGAVAAAVSETPFAQRARGRRQRRAEAFAGCARAGSIRPTPAKRPRRASSPRHRSRSPAFAPFRLFPRAAVGTRSPAQRRCPRSAPRRQRFPQGQPLTANDADTGGFRGTEASSLRPPG